MTELYDMTATYLQSLPTNQLWALGILCFLILFYELSATASYSFNNVTIEKVNKWPGRVLKIMWIAIAFAISNLWIPAGIAIVTSIGAMIVVANVPALGEMMLPTITEKEKLELRGGQPEPFGMRDFPMINRNRFHQIR